MNVWVALDHLAGEKALRISEDPEARVPKVGNLYDKK